MTTSAERDHNAEHDAGSPRTPQTEHKHRWAFDGDDPYIVCACGARADALTGRLFPPHGPAFVAEARAAERDSTPTRLPCIVDGCEADPRWCGNHGRAL